MTVRIKHLRLPIAKVIGAVRIQSLQFFPRFLICDLGNQNPNIYKIWLVSLQLHILQMVELLFIHSKSPFDPWTEGFKVSCDLSL